MNLMLSELADNGFGKLGGNDVRVQGVSIDTRSIIKGNLFFAVRGPRFDGHDFCQEAAMKGAAALVVEERIDVERPLFLVKNTKLALQNIACYWRDGFELPIVAVTGSNGKTTVKEMIASIFSIRGKTLVTQGNLNNDFGVPLTLCRLNREHQQGVIEIGADHSGEISHIVKWVKPTTSVVTMIGPSHLQGFGSLQGVAQAKSEIYSGLTEQGVAVLNRDDNYFETLRDASQDFKQVTFGFHGQADVKGIDVGGQFKIQHKDHSMIVDMQLAGKHNRLNALAAAASALASGFTLHDVGLGLNKMTAVHGRLKQREEIKRYQVIDDTYNANPSSVKAAIDVLVAQKGISCLVLGDMKELGNEQENLHREVGCYAKRQGVDYLFCKGELVSNSVEVFGSENSCLCLEVEDLVDQFLNIAPKGSTVLVKGSRSAKMEDFINLLIERLTADGIDKLSEKEFI